MEVDNRALQGLPSMARVITPTKKAAAGTWRVSAALLRLLVTLQFPQP